jgi:hypothetical protein
LVAASLLCGAGSQPALTRVALARAGNGKGSLFSSLRILNNTIVLEERSMSECLDEFRTSGDDNIVDDGYVACFGMYDEVRLTWMGRRLVSGYCRFQPRRRARLRR